MKSRLKNEEKEKKINRRIEAIFARIGGEMMPVIDRDSGRSKGFGFVEMSSGDEATAAIGALNGQEHDGRAIKVNEAKPREDRGGSGGGRGGYGGGGGGNRRY
jgi:RNA recognition motif-containing protein